MFFNVPEYLTSNNCITIKLLIKRVQIKRNQSRCGWYIDLTETISKVSDIIVLEYIYISALCQSILIKGKWNWDDIESVKYLLLVLPEIPGRRIRRKWFLSLKIERKSRANISVRIHEKSMRRHRDSNPGWNFMVDGRGVFHFVSESPY